MTITRKRLSRFLILYAFLSSGALGACGDEPTPVEPEPQVTTIRVTVGASTIDVPYPSGPHTAIPLQQNQVNQLSFRFLGADGQDEPIIVAERANLVLDVGNLQSGWTFTATGGSGATFTGTITPTTTGSYIPLLHLENTEHGHDEVRRLVDVIVTP